MELCCFALEEQQYDTCDKVEDENPNRELQEKGVKPLAFKQGLYALPSADDTGFAS